MNKRVLAALVTALATLACGGNGAIQCQPSATCGTSQVQVCCSTQQCEYRVDGMTFACAGTNCVLASGQVLAYCPPDSGISPFDAATDAALCPDAGLDGGLLDASGCVR